MSKRRSGSRAKTKLETKTFEDEYSTEELKKLSKLVWVDFLQMKEFCEDPLILEEGEGIRVKDVNGKWYIDGTSGVAVSCYGHKNKAIINAIIEQHKKIAFGAPTISTNVPALKLAKIITSIAPKGFTTVKFSSGGTEVLNWATRVVRQYHRQKGNPHKKILVTRFYEFAGFDPDYIVVHHPYSYRCPFKCPYPDCNLTCAHVVDETIRRHGAENIAAFRGEPIGVSAGGVCVPPRDYWPMIREICDKHNVLMIYDEIVTGFGRMGKMFGAERVGMAPDILCCGKGLSGGYAPLSAMLVRDTVADAFWGEAEERIQFGGGHTYGANPISCAAGCAALKQLIERKLPENAARMERVLKKRLQEMYDAYRFIGRFEAAGLAAGMEFVRNRKTREGMLIKYPQYFSEQVQKASKRRGLIIRARSNNPSDFITFTPPLIVTEKDVNEICDILDASLGDVGRQFNLR